MSTVAIIGTAGRGLDADRLDTDAFQQMVANTTDILVADFGLSAGVDGNIHAVSGGAAWADHVAVTLFLQGFVKDLTLHLPCAWDKSRQQYADTGGDWRINPGRTANIYHRQFSARTGRNSLAELQQCMDRGCSVRVWPGFHARNNKVAQSDFMVAHTLSRSSEPPPSGGTRYTWDRASGATRMHVPI